MNRKQMLKSCCVAVLLVFGTTPLQAGGLGTAVREGMEQVFKIAVKSAPKVAKEPVDAVAKQMIKQGSGPVRRLVARHGEEAACKALSTPLRRKLVTDLGADAGSVFIKHGSMGEKLLTLAPTKEAAGVLAKLNKAELRHLRAALQQGSVRKSNLNSVLKWIGSHPKTAAVLLGYGCYKLLDMPDWMPEPVQNAMRLLAWLYAGAEWLLSHMWAIVVIGCLLLLKWLGLLGLLGQFLVRCISNLSAFVCRKIKKIPSV